MKQVSTLSVSDLSEHESMRCCIVRVRSLLDQVRTRHDLEQADSCLGERSRVLAEDELPTPSSVHVGELETPLVVDCSHASASTKIEIRYDDPRELARARWMFALSWLVPLLLVSATLAIFGSTLGRALSSLLHFSMFAMSVPLTGSVAALLVRGFQRRVKRRLATAPKRP